MNPSMKDLGIDRLTAHQRVALALEIWESLEDNSPAVGLSAPQREELLRRDAEMDADAGVQLTWQQIRDGLNRRP